MQLLYYGLFALLAVGADQLVKHLVVTHIPLYTSQPLIPGIVQLTYVQNTGAAFSMLQGAQWLFILVFVLFTGLILWEYFRKPLPFRPFERWCIAAVYAGGVGNMIDRVCHGYVVDMFDVQFMEFAIFNVADIFIVCGSILLMVHLVFFNKEFWKDEKK